MTAQIFIILSVISVLLTEGTFAEEKLTNEEGVPIIRIKPPDSEHPDSSLIRRENKRVLPLNPLVPVVFRPVRRKQRLLSPAAELFNKLTNENVYNLRERPNEGTDIALVVNTSTYVYFIAGINAIDTEYSVQLLMRHQWKDPRLRYDDINGTDNVETIEGEAWHRDKIWIPNIYYVNEKEAGFLYVTRENVLVAILPDGTVNYNYRIKLRLFCNMEISKFPFDTQTCHIIMESWKYSDRDLILRWDDQFPVEVNSDFELPEYSLIGTYVEETAFEYPNQDFARNWKVYRDEHFKHSGNFSTLLVHFKFGRKSGHYILDYYVPSAMLVFTSWVSFWLDPNAAPARVALGTSTMLTFFTLIRNTDSTLPKVSYITCMEIWFFGCTAFIFLSLLEFAFVNIIHRRSKNCQLKKVNTKYILKSGISPSSSRRNSLDLNPTPSPKTMDYTCNGDSAQDRGLVFRMNEYFKKRRRSVSPSDMKNLKKVANQVHANNMRNMSSQSNQSERDSAGLIFCPSQLSIDNYDTVNSISSIYLNPDDGCYSFELPVPGVNFSSDPQEKRKHKSSVKRHRQWTTMTPQQIAKWIDTRSRFAFPVAFFIFNMFYWGLVWV